MKKLLSVLSVMLLVFTLGACSAKEDDVNKTLVEMEEIFSMLSDYDYIVDYDFSYDVRNNAIYTEIEVDPEFAVASLVTSGNDFIATFEKLNAIMYDVSTRDEDLDADVYLTVTSKQINNPDNLVELLSFRNGRQVK